MTGSPAREWEERLDTVMDRLERHLATDGWQGLTAPDQPSGERWEAEQVWAHLSEFVPYWLRELHKVVTTYDGRDPVPFGRTKEDPKRIAYIEDHRGEPPAAHMELLRSQAAELRSRIVELSPEQWSARGVHKSLGVMDVAGIMQHFLVGHLEQHADQLDSLAPGAGSRGGSR